MAFRLLAVIFLVMLLLSPHQTILNETGNIFTFVLVSLVMFRFSDRRLHEEIVQEIDMLRQEDIRLHKELVQEIDALRQELDQLKKNQ